MIAPLRHHDVPRGAVLAAHEPPRVASSVAASSVPSRAANATGNLGSLTDGVGLKPRMRSKRRRPRNGIERKRRLISCTLRALPLEALPLFQSDELTGCRVDVLAKKIAKPALTNETNPH